MSLPEDRCRQNAFQFSAHLGEALRAAGVGVWCVDLTHDRPAWSEEVARLLGLQPDAALTLERVRQALHPDDLPAVLRAARTVREGGEGYGVDCRVVWPDGSMHWVSIKGCVHKDAAGRPASLLGVMQDIEERKRLQLELEETQRTLSALLGNLPGLVYRCRNDERWSAEFVTEGVRALTGYAPADFTEGRIGFAELIPQQEREQVVHDIHNALDQRGPYQATYPIETASGEQKWVMEQGAGVYDEHGELLFLEGFITDVTDRKRAEDYNARLEQQLQQAQRMEALGTLAGGIAHDFNNMLAVIHGNASLALTDLPPGSPALTSVKEIQRSAARASDLVRQILTFSRQQPTGLRPIALHKAMAEAVKLLKATLPATIELRCDFPSDLPAVLADATQIHQVITNLGVNAAQAIGAREGLIEFTLDLTVLSEEEVRRTPPLNPGRHLRLRVRDNGPGMDRQTVQRVFDPFFTTKPAGQGTGLGLPVVHGIMKAHAGAIVVDSALGAGTTFCLYFPIAEHAVAVDESEKAPPVHGRGERILFVDDEEALVFLAQRALQRLGYSVTGMVDPLKALEIFRSAPLEFDFVVTDVSMPGMSGRDLAREVLRLRPDIPVVLTSGYVRSEDVQEARRIGARDIVFKPNSIDDLARVVEDALVAKRAPHV